jgi:simple sugar transport system ATP-binding protein
VLEVEGLLGEGKLNGISLQVRAREILGIAGVEGNGQRELALVLSGRATPDEGRAQIPAGVGFVPQDRTHAGLVADFDLAENMALALHRDAAYRSGPLLRWSPLRARTAEVMARFHIRAPGPGTLAANLSGGNQQRLVVARELVIASDLLVAENPTRGLDVASASFVHRELGRIVADPRGPGVVLISTDLDEVLALSHRVLVMVRGKLEEVPAGARTREGVGARMLAGARAGGPADA